MIVVAVVVAAVAVVLAVLVAEAVREAEAEETTCPSWLTVVVAPTLVRVWIRRRFWMATRGMMTMPHNLQPSAINHQPSTINHQPSTLNHQFITLLITSLAHLFIDPPPHLSATLTTPPPHPITPPPHHPVTPPPHHPTTPRSQVSTEGVSRAQSGDRSVA